MSCHEISSHDTHSTRDTRMAGGTQPSTLHGSREPSADTRSLARRTIGRYHGSTTVAGGEYVRLWDVIAFDYASADERFFVHSAR
jgi:hypothetical protein